MERAVLRSVVWAVIRHKEPKEVLKWVWRIRADFWQGLKSEEERVSQAEGSKYTKAGVERGHGALSELNIPGRK